MNIITSLSKDRCEQVLNGRKNLIFFYDKPKEFDVGDKIYIYENWRKGGSKKIVGECKVADIIPVKRSDGKWPTYGCYPFIEHYYRTIKKDIAIADKIKAVQDEFNWKPENYKYGYILSYVLSELELENIRTHGEPINTWKIHDMNIVREILDCNEKSRQLISECDDWLMEIGLYNTYDESYFEYGVSICDVKQYKDNVYLYQFVSKQRKEISKVPTWTYTVTDNTFS